MQKTCDGIYIAMYVCTSRLLRHHFLIKFIGSPHELTLDGVIPLCGICGSLDGILVTLNKGTVLHLLAISNSF